MRGKKIYRSAMIAPFRLVLMALVVFFFHDFYLATFQEPKFIDSGALGFMGVVHFHLKYPREFLVLTGLVLFPFIYYAFIRGVRFFEKGYVFNRGLPFVNSWVPYETVDHYKLLAPKSIIAIFTKSGDIQLVADGNIERVIALLDQHGVKGDLAQDAYVRLIQNVRRFFIVVAVFTVVLYTALKMGWFKSFT